MMNLIIGLLVGVASAVALLLMWRAAERLGKEVDARRDSQSDEAAH